MTQVAARIVDCSKVRRVQHPPAFSPGGKVIEFPVSSLVSFFAVFPGRAPGQVHSLYIGPLRLAIDGGQVRREAFESRWGDVIDGAIVTDLDLHQFGGHLPAVIGYADPMAGEMQ